MAARRGVEGGGSRLGERGNRSRERKWSDWCRVERMRKRVGRKGEHTPLSMCGRHGELWPVGVVGIFFIEKNIGAFARLAHATSEKKY
jgi:hypothetical protein